MVVLREGMCPGLDETLVKHLRTAQIKTVEDLVSADIERLAQKCSVSYKALFAIRRVLLAQHAAFPVSAADLYQELLSSTAILSTGHPRLDELLGSGLYTGELTEVCGGPGSGKSQVCFGFCVHISLHLKQRVVFIDTTGGLSAARLLQMLRAGSSSGEEQMEALQRIHIFRAFDIVSLLDRLFQLRRVGFSEVCVGGGSVRAVIVDSVSAVISPLLGAKHGEAMSLMMQVGGALKTMAKDFNMAALVTNHVTRNSGTGELQPGLGVSWSHVPRTRILLERLAVTGASAFSSSSSSSLSSSSSSSSSSSRTGTLIKSSRQPCGTRVDLDLQHWSPAPDASTGKRKLDQTQS